MSENASLFFNDTPTTEIYTLSLHDALAIWERSPRSMSLRRYARSRGATSAGRRRPRYGIFRSSEAEADAAGARDRKSTRLNSSHANTSYAVFCLKKKTNHYYTLSCLSASIN